MKTITLLEDYIGTQFPCALEYGDVTGLEDDWGHWAFARYCAKRQIPFETCYQIIFGRLPRI